MIEGHGGTLLAKAMCPEAPSFSSALRLCGEKKRLRSSRHDDDTYRESLKTSFGRFGLRVERLASAQEFLHTIARPASLPGA